MRSTCESQHVKNASAPQHFWKLRCRKSAPRCGAKHISKWKCTKHLGSGARLEVEMLTKVHSALVRSAFRSQTCKKLAVLDFFWKLRGRKSARVCGAKHMSKSNVKAHHVRTSFGGSAAPHYTTLRYATLQQQLQLQLQPQPQLQQLQPQQPSHYTSLQLKL